MAPNINLTTLNSQLSTISMDKYPGWSPYNYVMNNPLVLVDPDGMRVELNIKGEDAKEAYDELKDETKLTITFDLKSGQVTTGELSAEQINGLSEADRELYNTIQSKDVAVNLITTRENFIGDKAFNIGAYDGWRDEGGKKITSQFINMKHAINAFSGGWSTAGNSVKHEVLESYLAANSGLGYEHGHDRAIMVMGENQLYQNFKLAFLTDVNGYVKAGFVAKVKPGSYKTLHQHIIWEK